MSSFVCDCNECVNIDTFTGECQKDVLMIADFEDMQDDAPCCFRSYRDQPEYQEGYWIAVIEDDGSVCRKARKGKRLEVNGIVLFTDDRVPPRETWEIAPPYGVRCTEQQTGYAVSLCNVLQFPEKIKEYIAYLPRVEAYKEGE